MLSVCAEAVIPSGYGWMEWDVTNHVKDAIRCGLGNVDFLLMGSSHYIDFYSKEYEFYSPHLLVDGATEIKAVKDTYIKSTSKDSNYGSAKLRCDPNNYRPIISIPISDMQNGSTFQLKLYPYYYSHPSVSGQIVRCYKLTQPDWVESEATWNSYKTGSAWTTAGGDYVAEVEEIVPPYTFTHGTGTEADPYLVETAEDLNGVRDYLSAHFKQTADIDLSGYANWEPIGNATNRFTGIYDGRGFVINNLTINSSSPLLYVGLFGVIDGMSIIRDLVMPNASVNVSGATSYDAGIVAGFCASNTAKIEDCSVSGTLEVKATNSNYWSRVGGIIGGGGLILRCKADVNITQSAGISAYCCGGIAGFSGSLIEECTASGNINISSGATVILGGLVGYTLERARVTNCNSTTNVSGTRTKYAPVAGGLIGQVQNRTAVIENCYAIGSMLVNRGTQKGGLIGENSYAETKIVSSYYDTETSGCSDTGKGEPKTTAEMKTQSTFAGWDFASVWGIDPAKNDGYPYLLWQQFDPPPEPFQPWTPPKLEPSWWEGFKLPFNVLELDEDAPLAIQRNFKEIEHYINFLGKASGEIKDKLELLAAAPAPMSEEEMPDPEPETPPTDSYFAGYLLGKEGQMGSIDAAIKTDSLGGINEVWIARVIDKQAIVEIYNSDAPEHIFRTIAREFNLPLVNLGADVVDVAIEFDGTYDQYNIFVSETEPHIFWVERTANEDIIYTIKWDGVDPAPIPVELARANLGNMGNGINAGIDPNITV